MKNELRIYHYDNKYFIDNRRLRFSKRSFKKKKVTQTQEEVLLAELKNAKQVLRKDLPNEIVTIGKKVTIKDLSTNQEMEYNFVGPDEAKPKRRDILF